MSGEYRNNMITRNQRIRKYTKNRGEIFPPVMFGSMLSYYFAGAGAGVAAGAFAGSC